VGGRAKLMFPHAPSRSRALGRQGAGAAGKSFTGLNDPSQNIFPCDGAPPSHAYFHGTIPPVTFVELGAALTAALFARARHRQIGVRGAVSPQRSGNVVHGLRASRSDVLFFLRLRFGPSVE